MPRFPLALNQRRFILRRPKIARTEKNGRSHWCQFHPNKRQVYKTLEYIQYDSRKLITYRIFSRRPQTHPSHAVTASKLKKPLSKDNNRNQPQFLHWCKYIPPSVFLATPQSNLFRSARRLDDSRRQTLHPTFDIFVGCIEDRRHQGSEFRAERLIFWLIFD